MKITYDDYRKYTYYIFNSQHQNHIIKPYISRFPESLISCYLLQMIVPITFQVPS